MKIICGTLWRCLGDIETTWDNEAKITYIRGKIYKSEWNNCITDEQGNINHHWRRVPENEFFMFFRRYNHKRRRNFNRL